MTNNSTDVLRNISCFEPSGNTHIQRLHDLMTDPVSCIVIVLCPVALMTNILTITATLIMPCRKRMHSKLIVSLCFSDVVIIIGFFYHFILKIFNGMNLFQYCFKKSIVDIGFFLTLSNLIAIAADLYIGIMKPLQYGQIMTPVSGKCILIVIWVCSLLAGVLDFFLTYYELFEWQYVITGSTVFVFFLMIAMYTKICFEIKKMVIRNRDLHEFHNDKAIATTAIIIVTFFIGWMPNALFNIYILLKIDIEPEFLNDCPTKLFLRELALMFFIPMIANTICDPLIYAVRLKMVQNGYKRMFCKLAEGSQQVGNYLVSMYERRSTTVTIVQSNSVEESEIRCGRNDSVTNSLITATSKQESVSATFNRNTEENKLIKTI